jgi:hypothetical protein
VGGAASTGGSLVSTQGTSGAIMTTVEKAISTVVSSVVATGTKALQGALAGDSAAPKPPVSNAAGAPLLSPGMLVLGALALALVLMPSRR